MIKLSGNPDDLGEIYLMLQCTKRKAAIVVDSVFYHSVFNRFLVKPGRQNRHAYSRIQQIIAQ